MNVAVEIHELEFGFEFERVRELEFDAKVEPVVVCVAEKETQLLVI